MSRNRHANFELLRIIAMLMVVTMHFLSGTGALPEAGRQILHDVSGDGAAGFLNSRQIFAVLLESLCIGAVNVYVLISGYFLSQSDFLLKRLLRLLSQILFYTLLIPVILVSAGILPASEAFNIYHIWQCLFPVEAGHYWFVTAYVVLYLFTPVLNAAVCHMTKRQMKVMLGGIFLFFSVGKSLSPFLFASDKYGYDYGWFICLYLLAAYIRRFTIPCFRDKIRSFSVYLASVALTAATVLISLFVYYRKGGFEYYTSVPFHYNFIFCLTAAVGLFYTFYYIRIPSEKISRWIRLLASGTLGVYLIHEHIDISGRWTGWVLAQPSEYLGGYAIQTAGSVLAVYMVCTAVDLIRIRLFDYAGRLLLKTKTGRTVNAWIEKADECFRSRM